MIEKDDIEVFFKSFESLKVENLKCLKLDFK